MCVLLYVRVTVCACYCMCVLLFVPVTMDCSTVYGIIHMYLSLMIGLFVAGSLAKCLTLTSQSPAAMFMLSLCSAQQH